MGTRKSLPPDVTALLLAWAGESAALDALLPLVEGELRGLARRHMRRERRITPSRPRRWSTRRTPAHRRQAGEVAEPGPFFRDGRPDDAAHSR